MGNQRETLVPSSSKYITLLSYQADNTELESTITSNASIHNNILNCL